MTARWTILTPTAALGAVAGVLVLADSRAELDELLLRALGGAAPMGSVRLRRLLGVDDGLVARWTECSVELMPHGGVAVLRAVVTALGGVGVVESTGESARTRYPEARDEIEAQMLAALARARSPRAIDLLLMHSERCRRGEAPLDASAARQLRRLIEPALVVAIGPSNIGKSTLLNALAGRPVSIVADEPGTTRDHVGAMIDLGGVVVRYLDTPGIRAGGSEVPEVEQRALAEATRLATGADLLLLCGDPGTGPILPPALVGRCRPDVLRICLRADLLPEGVEKAWDWDLAVSAARGDGLAELVRGISERLVGPSSLGAQGAWRFWE